jgi:type IV pilus assembly protein PilB
MALPGQPPYGPSMNTHKLLGQILADAGKVTPQQVEEAVIAQQESKTTKRIGECLVELGYTDQETVSRAVAKQHGLPFVDLRKGKISPEIIGLVPKSVAAEHRLVPIKPNGKALIVAVVDALDLFEMDNLRFILNREVECALATQEALDQCLHEYYGISAYEDLLTGSAADVEDLTVGRDYEDIDPEDEAPVIRLVNTIIGDAVGARASDIHVEPFESRVRIRYRIDGICREMDSPPKKLQGAILTRMKIMAGMDIAEKRQTQDGRIKILIRKKDIDIRCSILPATYGETMVMRILDKEESLIGLDILGFVGRDYERFKAIIKRPNGIFLVTGPTGSGKTTTLYAALKELNRPDVKIITAENPVEYNLQGINQCQVNEVIGLNFSRILRAMLRQAPNIILVGEIRDGETAEIAIQAALTGHLVFSTLHTNDAPSALTRLIDMGVKPFLVASSIQGIMAQRLIRRLCGHCKEPYDPDPSELRAVGITPEAVAGKAVYRSVGCDECKYVGYRGRIACFELIEMDTNLRDLTFKRSSTQSLREAARAAGMSTLQEDGIRKVLQGISTIDEVLRVTHSRELEF